jgi:type I restriction enzyme S subunit
MKWCRPAIADFCQTGSGGTPSRSSAANYYGGHIPWVKSGELLDEPLASTEEFITEKGLQESSAKRVPPGAVLIAMYGATVGRTALLEIEATTNQAVCFLIPDKRLALSRYVWYALRASYAELLAKRVGGAQPNISQQIIKATQIPLPTLSEQSRIVELLDEADRLRRLRRETDAKAARILPVLFFKMFGDPATNPMGWSIASFANTFDDTTAGNEKLQSSQFLETGKIAVVDQGQSQIAGYSDDVSIAYRGKLPAIVFGDHTRIFKFIDHPFVLGADGVRVLTPKPKVNPLFAYWHCKLLNIPSAGYSRHFKYLKEKSFICPDEALQNRFSDLTQTVMSQTAVLETAAAKVEQIFSVLLDNAFSGQLTAKWREAHMKELLAEMEQQARLLNLPLPIAQEAFV